MIFITTIWLRLPPEDAPGSCPLAPPPLWSHSSLNAPHESIGGHAVWASEGLCTSLSPRGAGTQGHSSPSLPPAQTPQQQPQGRFRAVGHVHPQGQPEKALEAPRRLALELAYRPSHESC